MVKYVLGFFKRFPTHTQMNPAQQKRSTVLKKGTFLHFQPSIMIAAFTNEFESFIILMNVRENCCEYK